MLSLILTILCSASINLGFALAKEKGQRNLAVTWFNYFMASAVSAGMLLRSLPLEGKLSFSALAGNLRGGLTPESWSAADCGYRTASLFLVDVYLSVLEVFLYLRNVRYNAYHAVLRAELLDDLERQAERVGIQ